MELCAGGDFELNCISDFTVQITLTKKGLANYEKVVDAVFRYMQRLKEVGPQEWVHAERRKVGTISFDFAEKGDPMSFCVSKARQMPHFKSPDDMAHLIRHRYIADEFKADKLTEVAEQLANPTKCLIIVASKSFEDASLPIYEKWYKFNYSCEKLAESRLSELSAA